MNDDLQARRLWPSPFEGYTPILWLNGAVAGWKYTGDRPMNDRERYVCTSSAPWKKDMGPAQHPDAVSDGHDRDYGDGYVCAQYHCPNCGHHWEEELPQ